jgi:hypothetical protein
MSIGIYLRWYQLGHLKTYLHNIITLIFSTKADRS